MKSILLVGMLVSLAVSGTIPLQAEDQPKAASSKPVATVRKVTVQLLDKEGKKLAEVTTPAIEAEGDGDFDASVPLFQPGVRRWLLELEMDASGQDHISQLIVNAYDLDRSTRYDSDKGQTILPMQTVLRMATAYTGPGTYEIYRSLEERLVVVIE